MNTMNMPGFSAEASLYKSGEAPTSSHLQRFAGSSGSPTTTGVHTVLRALLPPIAGQAGVVEDLYREELRRLRGSLRRAFCSADRRRRSPLRSSLVAG